MRAVVLAALLAGCNVGDFLVPDWGVAEGACPGPWGERVLESGVVAVTRDACGFPDAALEYRLYWRGSLFAQGCMESDSWGAAIGNGSDLRLYDRRCTVGREVTCRWCNRDPSCDP